MVGNKTPVLPFLAVTYMYHTSFGNSDRSEPYGLFLTPNDWTNMDYTRSVPMAVSGHSNTLKA